MNRFSLFLISAALICCSCHHQPEPHLIPQPQDVSMGRGVYEMPAEFHVVCSDSTYFSLEGFLELLFPKTDVLFRSEGKADMTIEVSEAVETEGAYSMEISRNGVSVVCGSYQGAVAAAATLAQMTDGNGGLLCAEIQDVPRFEWRGFMLDVSRHFFSVDEVKTLLNIMAAYKLNRFHWHLADDQGWRVEIKSRPELTERGAWRDPMTHNHDVRCERIALEERDPSFSLDRSKLRDGMYGGYYTQDDVREVVAHAAALGIDVIPEIDMPGHSLKVVECYPGLSCGGAARWGRHFSVPLCPGNDAVLEFAKDVYREIFGMLPYEYVHLGADEVEQLHWESCRKCQARIRELGLKDEAGLQAWFVREMEKFFAANGKKLIGWDEIVSGGAPEDAVVMWWRDWRPDARTEAFVRGHEMVISFSEYMYLRGDQNRNSLQKVYGWEPMDEEAKEYADRVKGIQTHLWTEMCPSFENACGRIFPRLFAVSEVAWTNPQLKDPEYFDRKVLTHLKGFESHGLNYRIPDLEGFCDRNVFVDSAVVRIFKPFDDIVVRYTTDGSVPGPDSPVYEAPLTVASPVTLCFRAYTSEGMPGDIFRAGYVQSPLREHCRKDTSGLEPGLKADWYEYRGEACDSITAAPFNSTHITEGIYIPESVKGNIGLVFTGYINVPQDGIYSFYTYSDDGSFIRIDDMTVVENDGPHSRQERSGQAALKKGLHKVEARYFDHSGGILEAGFILEDGTRRPFAAGDFLH